MGMEVKIRDANGGMVAERQIGEGVRAPRVSVVLITPPSTLHSGARPLAL